MKKETSKKIILPCIKKNYKGTAEEITSEVVEETQLTAFEEVILTTAGQYNNPGENQANLILPLPYGNLFEGSGSGVWVCPCIERSG